MPADAVTTHIVSLRCFVFILRASSHEEDDGFNDTIPGIRSTHHPLAGTMVDSKNFYLQ